MIQTAFRLTKDDLALLEAARERAGLVSRVEALRYLLREWARANGVEVPKAKSRRSTRKSAP